MMQHPCPGERTGREYGPRGVVPGLGDLGFHTGQDFPADTGTPILAAHDGVILNKWWDAFPTGGGAGGNMVSIQGNDGYETRYAHMHTHSPLAIGQRVAAGQQIGQVGATGAATGPHLHWEALRGGRYVNPLPLITTTPSGENEADMNYIFIQGKAGARKGGLYAVFNGREAVFLGNIPAPAGVPQVKDEDAIAELQKRISGLR